MRVFEAPALALLRDPLQMPWRLAGELDVGSEGEQVAQQVVEEQVTGTVGEGVNPLAYRGGGRPPGILRLHLAHQPSPTQTREKIERNHLLKQRDDKMPMGVKKVRKQAMRAATGLAAYSLDAEPVVGFSGERSTLIGAPADQRTCGLAVRVRTAIWQGKGTALRQEYCDVFFDGTEKWLYNDHELGTPPLVVRPGSSEPRWEVSSFLLKVSAIIPAPVDSVNPGRTCGLRRSRQQRSITLSRRLTPPSRLSGLIIYSGPKWPYPDQSIRPITAGTLQTPNETANHVSCQLGKPISPTQPRIYAPEQVSLRKTATSIVPHLRLSSIFSQSSVGPRPATAAGPWEGWPTG